MPRRCTVCQHGELATINAALVTGTALAALSRTYSLSADALARHRDKHLPEAMLQATALGMAANADDLIARVAGLEADARRLGVAAEDAGDLRGALAAVRELTRMVELLGRLLVLKAEGEADGEAGVTIHVEYEPEWDLSFLTDEELAELERLQAKALPPNASGELPAAAPGPAARAALKG